MKKHFHCILDSDDEGNRAIYKVTNLQNGMYSLELCDWHDNDKTTGEGAIVGYSALSLEIRELINLHNI